MKVATDAIEFRQNGKRLFVTVLSAADAIKLTTVDHYDSQREPDDPDQGYQRPPERSRITRIGKYLVGDEGDGLYPTAVLLAARQPLEFAEVNGRLVLDTEKPLQVIDGQHRLAGLRYVIEEKDHPELASLELPAVIVEVPDRAVEMNQFRIVNGTAKSVRTDLVNAILTATAARRGEESIKESERWRVVVTRVVSGLNDSPDSPWHGLVIMPDEAGTGRALGSAKVVRATSFMQSLKPIYAWLDQISFFRAGSTLVEQADVLQRIVGAYWAALAEVVPDAFADPAEHVIQKTPGLFALHLVLHNPVLGNMYRARLEYTKDNFAGLLAQSPEITDAQFWHKSAGRAAAYGSMKGFAELANLIRVGIDPMWQ